MVAYLLRGDLRRRWPTALLLALLVMVIVGIVLASVAGARRSRSAFDRYLVDLRNPEALAIGPPEAVEPLEEAAGVVALLPFDLVAAFPSEVVGEDFYPMAVSLDGRVPYDYFRIPVVEGRQADASEPLEVVLSERTAVRLGRDVGDRLPIQTYEPGPDGAEPDPGAEPDGPSLELTVVGIARDPGDIGGRAADLTLTFLTPAFRERFGPDAIGSLASGSFVVLQDGTDLTSLAAEANDLGVELDSSFSSTARQQAGPTMIAIANALYVFAGVAGLAGLAAFAHAVTRTQQTAARDDRALLALGLHRHQRMARLAGPAAVAVVGGTGLGLGLAVAVSPMFPVGLARRAEPSLGVQVDGMVLAVGGAGALVVGLGIVIGTTALATRRPGRRPVRTSRFGRLLSDAGLSPAVVTGAALGGRGGGSVGPAAVGGVAFGVLGVLAAVTFATSVDRLTQSPELYGWGWDANIAGADLSHLDDEDSAAVARRILDDGDVAAVGSAVFQLSATLDGTPDLVTAVEVERGTIEPVIVRGRAPKSPTEIALARDSARAAGKDIGESVDLDLGDGAQPMRITGVVALPVSTDGGASTAGAFTTLEAVRRLGFENCEDEGSCYQNLVLRVAPGVPIDTIVSRYSDPDGGIAVDLPTPPGEVERLVAVESLPWFLAGFLALLATISVAYAAATIVRRRARDLAVLRSLGMTSSQLRAAVAVLVLSVTALGAVVGAALGVAIGRLVWREIVDAISLPFSPDTPAIAIVLVPAATLLIAHLAATFSRRAAGYVQPSLALRAE